MEGLEVNSNFWKNKKVCITGLTGFKGAWMGMVLQNLGAEVIGISLPSDENTLFKYLKLDKKLDSRIQDIRDFNNTKKQIDSVNPEIIFHMAAQSLVRESYQTPLETFATNVQGTVHILECIRKSKNIKSAVIVTSDKCYENLETSRPYVESDALGGHDPYSASKGACEIVSAAYMKSFFKESGQGVATARAGNVIGGGDFAKDRILPDCYRAFSNNKALLIRSPFATRPWQHVLEPISGYIRLAEKLYENPAGCSEAWNFGPSQSLTLQVEHLVNAFCERWGDGAKFEILNESQPHEAKLLALNCTKAQERLNWEPILSFSETLDMTVQWYKEFNKSVISADALTHEQIKNYIKRRKSHEVS